MDGNIPYLCCKTKVIYYMSFFSNLFKKKESVEENDDKLQSTGIPKERNVTITFREDDLPAVAVINEGLLNFTDRASFPYNLSIIIQCNECMNNGLPTERELATLSNFEESIKKDIEGDGNQPNALFFCRISWNETREMIWKIKDPQLVNEYITHIQNQKMCVREFDFSCDKDPNWEQTNWYFDELRKTKSNENK